MTAANLLLVPFAAESHTDKVASMLRTIGYEVTIGAEDVWLEQGPAKSTNLVVLLLARKRLSHESIIRRLENTVQVPSFAIIHRQLSGNLSTILSCCDDFSYSPCDEKELTLRIKRLLTDSPIGSNARSSIAIATIRIPAA